MDIEIPASDDEFEPISIKKKKPVLKPGEILASDEDEPEARHVQPFRSRRKKLPMPDLDQYMSPFVDADIHFVQICFLSNLSIDERIDELEEMQPDDIQQHDLKLLHLVQDIEDMSLDDLQHEYAAGGNNLRHTIVGYCLAREMLRQQYNATKKDELEKMYMQRPRNNQSRLSFMERLKWHTMRNVPLQKKLAEQMKFLNENQNQEGYFIEQGYTRDENNHLQPPE